MYKIMLLLKDSASEPLWTTYKVSTDSSTEILSDFVTDDIESLEDKVKELLITFPKHKIKLIKDMDFILDVVMADEN